MKFKKIFVKLAILLAVCGLLVGSPQVYAADDTQTPTAKAELAGSNEGNNGNSSNDIGKQEAGKTSNPDKSNMDADQGLTNALEKIQSELSNKADGYTLYIAIVGAGTGIFALLLAVYAVCKFDNLAHEYRRKNENCWSEINKVNQQLGSLSGKQQEYESEIQRLQERIAGERHRALHEELRNNPPSISGTEYYNADRINNTMSVNNMRNQVARVSEPIDIINKKHNEVLKEYTALISLYRNASPAFRNKRSEFKSRFEVVELACINAKERINTHEAPIYVPKANGDFWAIPVGLQDLYIVYPRATLDYEVNVHTTGGMSEVFNSNFRKEIKYNGFDVIAPAWFASKSPSWECKKEGQLELR